MPVPALGSEPAEEGRPAVLLDFLSRNDFRILLSACKNKIIIINQGLLDLDGRNSQNSLHQTWADF